MPRGPSGKLLPLGLGWRGVRGQEEGPGSPSPLASDTQHCVHHTGPSSQTLLCPWPLLRAGPRSGARRCWVNEAKKEGLTVHETQLVVDKAQHHVHDGAELQGREGMESW